MIQENPLFISFVAELLRAGDVSLNCYALVTTFFPLPVILCFTLNFLCWDLFDRLAVSISNFSGHSVIGIAIFVDWPCGFLRFWVC